MKASSGVTGHLLTGVAIVLALGTSGCVQGQAAETARKVPAAGPKPLPVSRIRFREVAADAGLDYRWPSDGPRPRTILQTMGYGCAFLDYDGDDNLDILLVGPRLALYKGDGTGRFSNVTRAVGLSAFKGMFQGCAVGDFDNDGFSDVYISAYQGGLLLHNEKGKAFRDVTGQTGLSPQPWGTSCAWADLNRDGYLDLIICNYVDFDRTKAQLCKQKDVLTACPPQTYEPLRSEVLLSVNGRHFRNATRQLLKVPASGNSLGIAVADADGSGQPDIAFANDLKPGDLYRRASDRAAFANIGATSGTATDGTGSLHAGMGVDWGDADRDGKLDLFVTTYSKETKCLYRNLGDGLFEEMAHLAGIGTAAWDYVAFGCKFLDADNDGWLDLIVANGHTSDNAHKFSSFTYRQPLQFFRNTARQPLQFTDETRTFARIPVPPIVGRGLAVGDYDNDGRVDALVVDGDGVPLLLHNETPDAGRWIRLRLIGAGEKNNRDAYGARVTVSPMGGAPVVTEGQTTGSYLSASDPRIHIGVGTASQADITVRWPNGREQTWTGLDTERSYRLKAGNTAPQ